jgi:hypothetical protein
LDHGLCVSGGFIYNKDTIRNTLTSPLVALKMKDTEIQHSLFEIINMANKPATSILDLFHNTLLERYLQPQFIVFGNGESSNMSSKKFVYF